MKEEILAIITARGNSKGILRKNLYPLNGKPLIYWTIKEAKQSKKISRIVVTSEDEEILAFSKKEGVEIIERPNELSGDSTSSAEVIRHALEYLKEKENYIAKAFILLQPTSPLRTADDIDSSLDLFLQNECSAVVSSYRLKKTPLKNFILNEKGYLEAIRTEYLFSSRHNLPETVSPNGAIFIIKTDLFLQTNSLLAKDTLPFFMEEERSIDIDSIDDIEAAEKYFREKHR